MTAIITKDSTVDLENAEAVKAAAAFLREQLDYSMMECRKAIHVGRGNINEAAEYLASGAWMRSKLISWNWQSLSEKCDQLSAEMGLPETMCMPILKNCCGNLELAKRKLMCLPALP